MKTIELKRVEAIRFFGSVERITELLSIKQPAVAQWPDLVPEKSAWALLHLSKQPKWRNKKPKLMAFINV